MISPSDDLYKRFFLRTCRRKSVTEFGVRRQVRHRADRCRMGLMIVLGWYGDLYEPVPQKINVTVQGILEKIQSAAAAEAESSRVVCRCL